jgi:quercetin dioxygenase-like cupin family protein
MDRVEELLKAPVLGPQDGHSVDLGGLGVRFMLSAAQTDGGFALVEHPLAPRALAAPMHTHTHEDEYSYVLEGRVGFQLDEEVVEAGPGELVFKPRGVRHSFWNAGDEPARLLELISPGGFEQYFAEIAEAIPADGPPDMEKLERAREKYGLEMELDSVPELCERHGLTMGR